MGVRPMEQTGNVFRSAVVGGFNRQDVLNFIESSTRQNTARLISMQRELEKTQKIREDLEQELSVSQKKVESLGRELESLQKDNEEKSTALSSAQEELSLKEQEFSALKEEFSTLKEKTARWEDSAKAYEELKDRTATIELEAHQRAQDIEKQAEEKAQRVRAAAEQILHRVQAGYGRLRGDLDATITHAAGEMGRVDKALDQVRAEFAEHDTALENLLRSCQDCVSPQEPYPLPLDE